MEELEKMKKSLIDEIERRIEDKIIENTNAQLIIKLINSAESINEAIMIGELGTTYKRTGLHFDKRFGTPACSTGGYPQLKRGSLSNYVLIAQDDLNTLGYRTGGLDGIFGAATQDAVRRYQASVGLAVDGIVGCNTWRSLQEAVVGAGRTSTTID